MNRIAIYLATILMLCFGWQISALGSAGRVAPFAAKYVVENDYMSAGVAYLKLNQHDAGGYAFTFQTRPSGVLKLLKKGVIKELALLPALDKPLASTFYSYEDKGHREKSYAATLDRASRTATIDSNGTSTSVPLTGESTDRMSMMLRVMQELSVNPHFTTLTVDELGVSGVRPMAFTNRGLETLSSLFGGIETTRIHNARENSRRETVTWFAAAPESGILVPLQIEQYKRGELILRLRLTGFSQVE